MTRYRAIPWPDIEVNAPTDYLGKSRLRVKLGQVLGERQPMRLDPAQYQRHDAWSNSWVWLHP